MCSMARGGAAAQHRPFPLIPDTALLLRPSLHLHPAATAAAAAAAAAAADSLQQSLQELDLVPQAVLLMQPEED